VKITRTVKKILDNYESDCPGTKANLARILMHGRLGGTGKMVILPVDQGFEHGPARSFAPNPDGLRPALPLPAGDRCRAERLCRPPRPDRGRRRHLRRRHPDHPQGATPPTAVRQQGPGRDGHRRSDALRLGCSAIGFTIYPGAEDQYEMMEEP
jgi:class I fructose-bisphosphate aldolase